MAVLFERYGKQLIDDQRRTNWTTIIDVTATGGSGLGWWLGIAILEPVTITLSVFALARNEINGRLWKQRKAELKSVSDWIAELLK